MKTIFDSVSFRKEAYTMKSLNKLDSLGKVVAEEDLEKVSGGKDWRYSANVTRWMNFLRGIGNIAEAASHAWG